MAYEDYQLEDFGTGQPSASRSGGSIPQHILDILGELNRLDYILPGIATGLQEGDVGQAARNAYRGAANQEAFNWGDVMGIPRPDDKAPWEEYLPQLVAHEAPQMILSPWNLLFAPAKAAGVFPRIAKGLAPLTKVREGQSIAGKVGELAKLPEAVQWYQGTPVAKLFTRRLSETNPKWKGWEEASDVIQREHNPQAINDLFIQTSNDLKQAAKEAGVGVDEVLHAAQRKGLRPELDPLVEKLRPQIAERNRLWNWYNDVREESGLERLPGLEAPGYEYFKHMEVTPKGGAGGKAYDQLGEPNAYSQPHRTVWRWEDEAGKVAAIGKENDLRTGIARIPKWNGELDEKGRRILDYEDWYVGPDNIKKGRRVKTMGESGGPEWTDIETGKTVTLGEPGTGKSGIVPFKKWTGELDEKGNKVFETEWLYVGPGNVVRGQIRVLPPSPGHEFIDETGTVLSTGQLGKNATGVAEIKSSEGTKRLYVGENIKKGTQVGTWPEGGRFEFIDSNGQVTRTGQIGKGGIVKIGNEYFDIGTRELRQQWLKSPLSKITGETKNFVPFESTVRVKAEPLPVDALPGTEITTRPLPIQEPGIPVKPLPQEPVMPGFQVFKKPASLAETKTVTPNRMWLEDPAAINYIDMIRRNRQIQFIRTVKAGLDHKVIALGPEARAGMRPIKVKGFEGYQAEPAVANRLENMGRGVFDTESGAGSIADLVDKFVGSRAGQAMRKGTDFWRGMVLAHPGWFMGNVGSNIVQQAMETNPLKIPSRMVQAGKLQLQKPEMFKELAARGLADTGMYGRGEGTQKVRELLGEAMPQTPGLASKLPESVKGAGRLIKKYGYDKIFEAGSAAESNAKISVALDWLAKNAPDFEKLPPEAKAKVLDEAARVAHRTLGNYSREAMTPFERNLAALPFPFYGWSSHVARSTGYNLAHQPQKLDRMSMMLDAAFQPMSPEDKKIAPDYIQEQSPAMKFLGMPFPTSSAGLPTMALLGRYLPWGQLEQFANRPIDAGLSWINPYLKAPFELGGNRSSFKGREIDKLAGGFPANVINPVIDMVSENGAPYERSTNKLFGQSIPAGYDYLLGISPFGRHIKEADVLGGGLGLYEDPNREPMNIYEAGGYVASGGKFYPFDRARYEKSRKWEAQKAETAIKSNLNYARRRGDWSNVAFYQKQLDQTRARNAGRVE